MLVLFRIRFL